MGMSSGNGGDELNVEINVTPLVDVMLVLLIIFMVTAPMMNTGVDIDLPPVTAQALSDAESKLILSIDRNQKLQFASTPISWADLQTKLQTNERLKKEGALYVEADQALPYGVVVTAMAMAREAGVPKVMMLTDPSKTIAPEVLDGGKALVPSGGAK